MIELGLIRDLVAIFGVIAGFTYYVLTVRNAQRTRGLTLKAQEQATETRQAQLFMDLYETYRSPEFRHQFYSLIMQHDWRNYEEYMEKYGPATNLSVFVDHGALIGYFDGVRVLLKKGLVDVEMVYELLYPMVTLTWEKLEPTIIGARSTDPARTKLYNNFEYLYNELKKREQENIEPAT